MDNTVESVLLGVLVRVGIIILVSLVIFMTIRGLRDREKRLIEVDIAPDVKSMIYNCEEMIKRDMNSSLSYKRSLKKNASVAKTTQEIYEIIIPFTIEGGLEVRLGSCIFKNGTLSYQREVKKTNNRN